MVSTGALGASSGRLSATLIWALSSSYSKASSSGTAGFAMVVVVVASVATPISFHACTVQETVRSVAFP